MQTVVTDREEIHKRKLVDSVAEMATRLQWQEKSKLQDLLREHHNVFGLEDGERGETGMVQMTIDTGDCCEEGDSTSIMIDARSGRNTAFFQPLGKSSRFGSQKSSILEVLYTL